MSLASFASTRPQQVRPPVGFSGNFGAIDIDRRTQRRARANWAARLINAAGNVNVGRVCDVSEGGFGLMSAVNMPVGALLEIAVAVPKGGDGERSFPVRCKVRIVSCSFAGIESRLSVQFLTLPKESRIAIRNYVLSHS